MSTIRCIYQGVAPDFPATDQHPDAVRYERTWRDQQWFVDAIGGEPTVEDMDAVLDPPPPASPTVVEFFAERGLSVDDLKSALGCRRDLQPYLWDRLVWRSLSE